MSTRIYIVKAKTGEQRLVEAGSASQAIRHVVKEAYAAEVATTKEVAQLYSVGTQVEIAGPITEERIAKP